MNTQTGHQTTNTNKVQNIMNTQTQTYHHYQIIISYQNKI